MFGGRGKKSSGAHRFGGRGGKSLSAAKNLYNSQPKPPISTCTKASPLFSDRKLHESNVDDKENAGRGICRIRNRSKGRGRRRTRCRGRGRSTSQKSRLEAKQMAPGLVLLRRFLSPEDQRYLAQEVFAHKDSALHEGTFYREKFVHGTSRTMFELNMGTRGRMVDLMDAYPDKVREMCLSSLHKAQEIDPDHVPVMNPTTLLINFYQPNATFKWHQDSEHPSRIANNTGYPIVSFTIGLSADFGIKTRYDDENHETVRLNSGDVIIFGGPARMIVHSVLQVIPGSMPSYLQGFMRHGRLNITFRDVSDGVVDTSKFPAYRVSYEGQVGDGTSSYEDNSSNAPYRRDTHREENLSEDFKRR